MSVITAVLSPLIKLWLKSQVQAVEDLEVNIYGKNRQILQGKIPKAHISGRSIIYEGLYISQLDLVAESIHLNIPQILQGEALKLLEPLSVQMDMLLEPKDLKRSLVTPLVTEAIAPASVHLTSDAEIKTTLEDLLQKLGDQFALQDLSVVDGGCHCQGLFTVAATE